MKAKPSATFIRPLALLALIALTGASANAFPLWRSQSSAAPREPVPDAPPLLYRLIRSQTIDIDRLLQSNLGLKAETCRFTNAADGSIGFYSGVGACLYLSFRASMSTDAVPGEIAAVFSRSTAPNDRIRATLTWRPKRLDQWSLVWSALLAARPWGSSQIDIQLDDLLGVIDIRFVEPLTIERLASGLSNLLSSNAQTVARIRLQTESGTGSEQGHICLGQTDLFGPGSDQPFFRIDLSTNFSLFGHRPFWLEGSTGETPP